MYDAQIQYAAPAAPSGSIGPIINPVAIANGALVPKDGTIQALHDELVAVLGRLNTNWDNVVSVTINRRTQL